MPLVRSLLENGINFPDRAAWIDVGTDSRLLFYSWSDIADQVVRVAQALSRSGVRPGHHVAILSGNSIDMVVTLFALRVVGCADRTTNETRSAIDIVLDTRLPNQQIEDLLDHSDANFVLVESKQADREIRPPVSCKQLALPSLPIGVTPETNGTHTKRIAELKRAINWASELNLDGSESIIYTSGTTDQPKGVVLTHGNLLRNAGGKLAAAPQKPEDRRLTILPISHAYARTCDIGTWVLSGSVLAVTSRFEGLRRDAPLVRPTLVNVVPHVAEKIVQSMRLANDPNGELQRLGLDELRLMGCGGAALSQDSFKFLARSGITVIQGYGLTETSPVICSATPEDAAPGVVGHPVRGMDLRFDSNQQILCRGDGVANTYHKNRGAMRVRMTDDGWFQTGDLGALDSDGRLRVLGRIDDLIVLSTGRKVMPATIETLVCNGLPAEHVLVTGSGQSGLTAWIRLVQDDINGFDAEVLRSRIADVLSHLPNHEIPRVVKEMPFSLSVEDGTLTAKGTIRRRELMQRLEVIER